MHIRHLGVIALVAALATPVQAAPDYGLKPNVSSPQVSVASFGVFQTTPQGQRVLQSQYQIPFKAGTNFGWRICLKDVQGEVTWVETFRLPQAPKTWSVGPDTKISVDKRRATTTRKVTTHDGCIENGWILVAGDPKGHHSIDVSVGGQSVSTFHFSIN